MAIQPITDSEFQRLIADLGPFAPVGEPVGVAVSGGADSICLAMMVARWHQPVIGMIIDHGLRAESADEAKWVAGQLERLGVVPVIRRIEGLSFGSALLERARQARYRLLEALCAEYVVADLFIGHHAADQVETLVMRMSRKTGVAGMAGMARLVEMPSYRMIRPFLGIHPQRLRESLSQMGQQWVEDPSNKNVRSERVRIRSVIQNEWHKQGSAQELLRKAILASEQDTKESRMTANNFAACVNIYPGGYATLSRGVLCRNDLGILVRTLNGRAYLPRHYGRGKIARKWQYNTLAGIRFIPLDKYRQKYMLLREESAVQEDISASDGVIWDGRFIVSVGNISTVRLTIGAVRDDIAVLPRRRRLGKAAMVRVLPCFRREGEVVAIPHVGWYRNQRHIGLTACYRPLLPLCSMKFY